MTLLKCVIYHPHSRIREVYFMRPWLIGFVLIFSISLFADDTQNNFREKIDRTHDGIMKPANFSLASQNIDVLYYRLNFDFQLSPNHMQAQTLIRFKPTEDNVSGIDLDFDSYLSIDGVSGGVSNWQVNGYVLSITLDRAYNNGEIVEVTVDYSGIPRSYGFYAGFNISNHGSVSNGTEAPIISTLSEPYGARSWWPCKDDPSDKPDSVDIIITVPDNYYNGYRMYAVSNGSLRSITDNLDGTRTFFWHERYPIATYLVSLAISNYRIYSDYYVNTAGDSMPVHFYVYPERYDNALDNYGSTVDMIATYSNLFVEYPFFEEKYGMANFNWGGAMEHQTVSSMGSMNFWVVAHELAHQWFGDLVTCADFHHIWLNEGWASYMEALYAERLGGSGEYRSYMMDMAYYGGGTIFVEDPFNEPVFAGIVYNKGAWVLHMLRNVMGNDLFFPAVRAYLIDQQFSYKAATTEDFQAVMEQFYGASLQWFFQQWIYGSGYPQYYYDWWYEQRGDQYVTTVAIEQVQNGQVFTMPVDLMLMTIPGPVRDTVQVFNDRRFQTFQFVTDKKPAGVSFDPEDWILSSAERVTGIKDRSEITPLQFALYRNYPNPFNPSTIIRYSLPNEADTELIVFNSLGQLVERLVNERQHAGIHQVKWDASGRANGVYYIQLRSGENTAVEKALFIK